MKACRKRRINCIFFSHKTRFSKILKYSWFKIKKRKRVGMF